MPYENEFAHYKPLKRLAESAQIQAMQQRMHIADVSPTNTPLPTILLSDLNPHDWLPDFVVAIDGSFAEVPVKNGYPAAAVGYVTVASVLLDVAKMLQLDAHRPVDPQQFRTIENAESIDGALPGSNVIIDQELDARSSFRRALFELLQQKRMSDVGESLLETYEALLAHKPPASKTTDKTVQHCPGITKLGIRRILKVSPT